MPDYPHWIKQAERVMIDGHLMEIRACAVAYLTIGLDEKSNIDAAEVQRRHDFIDRELGKIKEQFHTRIKPEADKIAKRLEETKDRICPPGTVRCNCGCCVISGGKDEPRS